MCKKSCNFAHFLENITDIMRKYISLIALLLCVSFLWAVDKTYYSTYIDNKSGATLFTGIHNVAKVGYSSLSYSGLWTAYATTDVYPTGHADAGKIWDMYGGCTFAYGSKQCGQYSSECDCYNREHSIPKSWFGSSEASNTPGSDIFHVVPTDGKVNGMRSNYAFGEVNTASYSYNGSQLGTPKSITIANTLLGSGEVTKSCGSTPVFEPIDEYKGDFARGYFGTMVRWASGDYQTFTSGDGAQIFNTAYDAAHYYGLTQYGLALLLKWHRQDPVSQKEIDRNNGIQTTQGNRNPFIDYPILAEYLWGKYAGQTFSQDNAIGSFEAGFTPGVSDGDKNGSTPTPSYTVTWMANGSSFSTATTRPADDPDDCSSTRVFRGWTGVADYSGNTAPSDLFTTSNPTITKDTTFYAVYANKITSGSGESNTENFVFANNGYTNQQVVESATQGDVTITFVKGTNNNAPKYYTSGSAIRCYGGNTITVAATDMTNIVFTFGLDDGSNAITSDVGTFTTNTWEGSAEEVVFTIGGTSGNRRIAGISVTIGGSTTTYSNFSLSCTTYASCASETGFDPSYYESIEGLQDSILKSTLGALTFEHYTTRYSYGSGKNNTWHAFWATDRNTADNSVIDMYSNNKRYYNPSDTTASVTDCDIEHMFPNSWFGGESGNKHAYCDLHHLVPADYSANRSKGNRGPGVPTDTTFNNNVWVNGNDANRGNLSVFCPPNEYKGDFARAFFYIAMTYGDTAVWQTDNSIPHMTNSDWHEFLPQTLELLLTWHRNDPVSDKERVRMNKVYLLQGNRNPFIDYPCLVEYIWGTHQGEAFTLSGIAPTPVETKYTITWNVKGETTSDQVTENTQPTAPSVSDCSESRVFKGWTTTSTVSGEAPTPLYAAGDIPNATSAVTYYAVFADKETTGENSTESVTFSSRYSENTVVEDIPLTIGTNSTVTFKKGSTNTQYYTTGYAIRWYGGGTCTITTSSGNISQIVFTYGSSDGTNEITSDVGTFETNTWTGNASTVVFTQAGTTGNRRIAGISVTISTSSVTTYSNYGLACSNQEPEYTVTFMDRGEKFYEETGVAGYSFSLPSMTDECTAHNFYGWSGLQYEEHNIDIPSIVEDPTTIPSHDTTYYAVYSKTTNSMSVPTNNYKKITTADELTSAKYLVVADTSELVAMSSELSGYYPIGVEVTANNADVITTENSAIIWRITVDGELLTLYNSDNGYLYIEETTSGTKTYYNIQFGNNTTNNKFTYSVTDGAWILTTATYSKQLEYYQSGARWTFYTSQGAPIYLYKQQLTSGLLTFYSTNPTCQYGPMTDIDTRPTSVEARKLLIHGQLFILIGDQLYDITGQRVR